MRISMGDESDETVLSGTQPADKSEEEGCQHKRYPKPWEYAEKTLPKITPSMISNRAAGDEITAYAKEAVNRNRARGSVVERRAESESQPDGVRYKHR